MLSDISDDDEDDDWCLSPSSLYSPDKEKGGGGGGGSCGGGIGSSKDVCQMCVGETLDLVTCAICSGLWLDVCAYVRVSK